MQLMGGGGGRAQNKVIIDHSDDSQTAEVGRSQGLEVPSTVHHYICVTLTGLHNFPHLPPSINLSGNVLPPSQS